jgi:hypothetical protein
LDRAGEVKLTTLNDVATIDDITLSPSALYEGLDFTPA